jgi:hypothetical protein
LNDASKFELGFPYNMLWDNENVHNIDDLVNGVFKADILKEVERKAVRSN